MFEIVIYANFAFSIAYIFWAYLYAKKKGTVFTFFLTSIYILSNGAFIFTNQFSSSLYGYSIKDGSVILACVGNMLFMCVAFLVTKIRISHIGNNLLASKIRSPQNGVLLVLVLLIIVVESRYLFFGGGIQRVLQLQNVEGRESLYFLRYDTSLAIAHGSGLFSALLAMRVMFPLCALALAYKIIINRNRFFIVLAVIVALINGLTALSTLQRSPFFNFMVVSLSAIAWAIYLKRYRNGVQTKLLGGKSILLSALFLLVGASIYAFTEGAGLIVGAYQIAERIFLISSFSTTSYYDLFGGGNTFGFAGLTYFFGFPVEPEAGIITYRDIGVAANGWPHNLNASFVGTAYASLGFSGVLIASSLVILIARHIDHKLRSATPPDRFAVIILNIFVVFEISNGPLMNGIYAGFFINIVIYFILFKKTIQLRRLPGSLGYFSGDNISR